MSNNMKCGVMKSQHNSPEQVAEMRDKQGIYMIGDSRMNIAGLNEATVPVLAEAIVAAGI